MVEINETQAAQGKQKATEVEKLLLSGDTQGAAEKFRQQYMDAANRMSPADAGNVLASERAQLKSMDSTGYNLLIIEATKHDPIVADEHITKKDLSLMSRLPSQPTAQDRFDADNAKDLLPQYDNLVSGTTHWFSKVNPLNWQSGFSDFDLNRVSGDLQVGERRRGMAAFAGDIFLRNNGELLDKVAGVAGTIDRSTLQLALDHDNKTKLFNSDQRTAVQWMHDNWDDPAVNQLKNGKDTWEDYKRFWPGSTFDGTKPFEGTRAAAEIGWQHGNSWGGPIAGTIEAAGAGLTGFLGGGTGAYGATGSLTKESLKNAYNANFNGNSDALTALNDRSKPYVLPQVDLASEDAAKTVRESAKRSPDSQRNDATHDDDDRHAGDSAPSNYRSDARADDRSKGSSDDRTPRSSGDEVNDNDDSASPPSREASVHRGRGAHHVDVDADAIKSALTIHKNESYWQSAERLLKLAGERPTGKDIRRVAHELWEADGRRSPKHIKSGHVIQLSAHVLKDQSLAALRDSNA